MSVAVAPEVKRNAFLLAGGLICNSGMFQLAAALSSLTLVAVTGVTGILGLGPAIFLASGAIAVGPAGRLMDRVGRMPVIRGGYAAGAVGCGVVAAGCAVPSAVLVAVGLSILGGAGAIIQLTRAAAAEMFPPERRARGMSFVLLGAVSGAVWGRSCSVRCSRTVRSTPTAWSARGSSASPSWSSGSGSCTSSGATPRTSPRPIRPNGSSRRPRPRCARS